MDTNEAESQKYDTKITENNVNTDTLKTTIENLSSSDNSVETNLQKNVTSDNVKKLDEEISETALDNTDEENESVNISDENRPLPYFPRTYFYVDKITLNIEVELSKEEVNL
jgi:hypothetical protein